MLLDNVKESLCDLFLNIFKALNYHVLNVAYSRISLSPCTEIMLYQCHCWTHSEDSGTKCSTYAHIHTSSTHLNHLAGLENRPIYHPNECKHKLTNQTMSWSRINQMCLFVNGSWIDLFSLRFTSRLWAYNSKVMSNKLRISQKL